MRYKHKFYLIDSVRDTKMELATCADESTANILADHYRRLYLDGQKKMKLFEVEYQHGREKKILD